jgi:hypothetical protein
MTNFREAAALDGPPILPDKGLEVNEGSASPMTAESTYDRMASALDAFTSYGFHFRKKGQDPNDPARVRITSTHVIVEGGACHTGFACDVGVPSQVLDPATSKMAEVWTRKIEKTAEGVAIFPEFHIAGWQFFEEYEPDFSSNRVTASEWQSLLRDHAAVLSRFKTSSALGAQQRAAESEKIRQAAAARMNPTASLAAGIAAGVAEALVAMGLKAPSKEKPV